MEVWKALKNKNSPLNIALPSMNENSKNLRSVSNGRLPEAGSSNSSKNAFINDCKRVWNNAPVTISSCNSIYSAQKLIKDSVKSLPL